MNLDLDRYALLYLHAVVHREDYRHIHCDKNCPHRKLAKEVQRAIEKDVGGNMRDLREP